MPMIEDKHVKIVLQCISTCSSFLWRVTIICRNLVQDLRSHNLSRIDHKPRYHLVRDNDPVAGAMKFADPAQEPKPNLRAILDVNHTARTFVGYTNMAFVVGSDRREQSKGT